MPTEKNPGKPRKARQLAALWITQRGNLQDSPQTPEDEAYEWLGELLAVLKALYLSHWDAHWKVMGDSFYGDHLLFSRMYEGLVSEIDTLAEKMVAMLGVGAMDLKLTEQTRRSAWYLEQWEGKVDLFYGALHAEEVLQDTIQKARDSLESVGKLSMGMDDFLPALANAHETNIYLLQQRIDRKLRIAAQPKWRVSLWSTEGKELWVKTFNAPDASRADIEALRLVHPELNKHDDAEDWIVEEIGKKR